MSVLVTGGAGFVGAYVTRDLLARGERVVAYDAVVAGNTLDIVLPERHENLSVVEGQIADGWNLIRVCEAHDVDRIVHLGSPLTADVTANPPRGISDICGAMASVLEVARALRARRVVWASSVAVFGPLSAYPPGPLSNDACQRPRSLYGSCKSLCEDMARTYRDEFEVDSIGLRLTVVYGAGRLRGYMSFPSALIRDCALGNPVTIPHPDQLMSWQYVEEVSGSVLAALDAPGATRSIAYNTYGDPRTFREAGIALAQLAPNVAITYGTDEPNALEDVAPDYDDSLFRRQVGYEPRFPLAQGVARAFEEYQRAARTPSVTR